MFHDCDSVPHFDTTFPSHHCKAIPAGCPPIILQPSPAPAAPAFPLWFPFLCVPGRWGRRGRKGGRNSFLFCPPLTLPTWAFSQTQRRGVERRPVLTHTYTVPGFVGLLVHVTRKTGALFQLPVCSLPALKRRKAQGGRREEDHSCPTTSFSSRGWETPGPKSNNFVAARSGWEASFSFALSRVFPVPGAACCRPCH